MFYSRNYMLKESSIETYARSIYEAVSIYKSKIDNQATVSQIAVDTTPTPQANVVEVKEGVRFYVQLLTSRSALKRSSGKLDPYATQAIERKMGSWYKYYVGGYGSLAEAREAQAEAKICFKDAFIVAFDGDEQISLAEAQKRLNVIN